MSHSSDCDVLAIRPPNVFEEIGGQENDWDDWLRDRFDLNRTVGVICEVKTGEYRRDRVFRKNNVQYCIGRLGFVPQECIGDLLNRFDGQKVIDLNDQYQIGKVLIANEGSETDRYSYLDLRSVRSFLVRRIERYPEQKYRDRMFFSSIIFQSVIDCTTFKRKFDNKL